MTARPRSVIVTGGTGALGSRVVAAFLAAGDRVTVPWIVPAERDALATTHHDALEAKRLSLLDADVAADGVAQGVAVYAGEPDVLVNGVGGFAAAGGVDATPLELWDRMYRVNLRTAVAMSAAVLPSMRERRRGVIVNVASQAAFARPPGIAAYAASKAAVVVLTESLQKEVAPDGIRVVAVAPSTIDTPANRAAMPGADFSTWTPPERIAEVILWLASDAASTVRGAIVPV
jgi:NAD(P)-dependent dehydrogenase (short-subunit alcohol dehydrogenase family)